MAIAAGKLWEYPIKDKSPCRLETLHIGQRKKIHTSKESGARLGNHPSLNMFAILPAAPDWNASALSLEVLFLNVRELPRIAFVTVFTASRRKSGAIPSQPLELFAISSASNANGKMEAEESPCAQG